MELHERHEISWKYGHSDSMRGHRQRLSPKNRPGSIGLISSAGILGSATSPTIVGFLKDLTASFNSGIWYALALLALGILTLLTVQNLARRPAT